MENVNAILCVDDEMILLLALREELRMRFGERFRYMTAKNGPEALKAAESLFSQGVRLIIVFSDWLMPGMKGDELLIELKRRHPGITAVMITGYADEAAIERVRKEAGLRSCLRKPWLPTDLFALVEEAELAASL